MEELRRRREELAVPVDCPREGLREPVECDVVEDLLEGWVGVGPLIELLADPAGRG